MFKEFRDFIARGNVMQFALSAFCPWTTSNSLQLTPRAA
jgi:hypothetical protein